MLFFTPCRLLMSIIFFSFIIFFDASADAYAVIFSLMIFMACHAAAATLLLRYC